MGTRATVTVLGSVNMDLVATTDTLPRPGETVLGSGFTTIPGGKGSNQAIAAAKAGGKVAFVGAVGDDAFGPSLVATLRDAGVTTDRVRTAPGASGTAVISVDSNAENSIIVIAGANWTLGALTPADAATIAASRMLLMQLEIPMSAVMAGARAAAAAGVPVLLNPSPVQNLPEELVADVTILVVNEGEAAQLGDDVLRRVPHVVTTLGASGARYRGPDGAAVTVTAPQVDAVDTTGAGDAFTGAFAVAWVEGMTPEDALRNGCAAGALATTVHGASAAAPSRDAIDALVRQTY